MAERTCTDCGADISDRHGNAKRCEPCSDLRQREVVGIGSRTRPCFVDDADCVPGRLKQGLCDKHYRRKQRTGTTGAPERIDHLQRYEVDANGCWLWTGAIYWNGYGSISEATYGTGLAHRASYEHHVGPIPDGMDLDHLCRVRHCIAPHHEPATGRSYCRECKAMREKRGRERRKAG